MEKIEDLLEQMHKKGLKITPQRRVIIEYIFNNNAPLSAQELFTKVRVKQPNISLDTVYRSLKFLCSVNMLYRIEKDGKSSEYELLKGQHLHYMICLKCGKRETFTECSFTHDIIKNNKKNGFRLTGHKFELYGFCASCDEK